MPNHADLSTKSRPASDPAVRIPLPSASPSVPVSARSRVRFRDDSLDIAKGFGIITVVLGHCLLGMINGGFFKPSAAWPDVWVSTIYLFHMPLFFVISGHLASEKHRPAAPTISKLIPAIVYPYFLWSILQG